MAQNEMRAKPALPERVRSMEGLGVTLCEPALDGFVPVGSDFKWVSIGIAEVERPRYLMVCGFQLLSECSAKVGLPLEELLCVHSESDCGMTLLGSAFEQGQVHGTFRILDREGTSAWRPELQFFHRCEPESLFIPSFRCCAISDVDMNVIYGLDAWQTPNRNLSSERQDPGAVGTMRWHQPLETPNPSLQPTRYGWLRQPLRAAELKR